VHYAPSKYPDVQFEMLHSAGFEKQLLLTEDACVAEKVETFQDTRVRT
jgi:hypothetical protein